MAIPSIITSDITTNTDIVNIITDKKLVYNKYQNLPSSYSKIDTEATRNFNFLGTIETPENYVARKLVAYSGSTNDLLVTNNTKARLQLLHGIQQAYSGTVVVETDSTMADIMTTDFTISNSKAEALAGGLVNRILNGNIDLTKNFTDSYNDIVVNANTLTITFRDTLDSSVIPDITSFSIKEGGISKTISNISIIGKTITIVLSSQVGSGQDVTISYTDSSNLDDTFGVIQYLAGSDVASFFNRTVTNNTIVGLGNDIVFSTRGDDIFDGFGGVDTISYIGAMDRVEIDLFKTDSQDTLDGMDTIKNIENIIGSSYNDNLIGNGYSNVIIGGKGIDAISGGNGSDILYGDDGNDFLISGGIGNDTIYGGAGVDTISWGIGADNIVLNPKNPNEADIIMDFVSMADKIVLDLSIFTSLISTSSGFIDNADFGTYVIYDSNSYSNSGSLYYDADGVGLGSPVKIAQLGTTSHPIITNGNIRLQK